MANKIAVACRFALVDTIFLLFIIQFLPNYIYGLLSLNSLPRLIVGIVQRTITKMVAQMSVCMCEHSNLAIYHPIFPNFIYGLLLSNFCSCLNMGFVRWTIISICSKTDILFLLQGIIWGPLSESDCSGLQLCPFSQLWLLLKERICSLREQILSFKRSPLWYWVTISPHWVISLNVFIVDGQWPWTLRWTSVYNRSLVKVTALMLIG